MSRITRAEKWFGKKKKDLNEEERKEFEKLYSQEVKQYQVEYHKKWRKENPEKVKEYYTKYNNENKTLKEENDKLKQQIADLETKLAESKEFLIATKWKVQDLEQQLAEKEELYSDALETVDLLFTNQDKIGYAVEPLERVKEWCEDNYDTYDDKIDNCKGKVIGLDKVIFNADISLYEYIDQLITEIKEGK